MKRILTTAILFVSIFFSSCTSNNKIDLTDQRTFYAGDYKFQPDTAVVNDDESIDVTFEWSHGSNEDSMKKEKFISSGIYLFAQKNNVYLEDDLLESKGLYSEVYEMTKAKVTYRFMLKNTSDDVDISFTIAGNVPPDNKFVIHLP